jgi:peptide chain release factor subunit 1
MTSSIESELTRLESLETDESSPAILTAYIVTDTSTASGRDLHGQLSALAARLRPDVPERELEKFEREIERVGEYLRSRPLEGRAVCVFASEPRKLLWTVTLPVRVASDLNWDTGPYLRPLRAVLDEYERNLVVLVDKERARFFTLFLDEMEEHTGLWHPVPGRHRQTGGASGGLAPSRTMLTQGGRADTGITAFHEMSVQQHIRDVLATTRAAISEHGIDRIILGGSAEAVSAFRHLAARPIAERIGGTIHVELFADTDRIRHEAQAVARHLERRAEQALVLDLFEREGEGRAVFGPQAVVETISDGNVYLFAFAEGAEISGGECRSCGRLMLDAKAAGGTGRCPDCEGSVEPIADLVDALARRALDIGGRVEEIRGEAAEWLAARGGVAVKRRYSGPAAA